MDWSYIAGMVDGEGTVGVFGQHVTVRIANSFKPALDAIMEFVGYGFLYAQGKSKAILNPKTLQPYNSTMLYIYKITRHEDVERFLLEVLPHLIIKRDRAEYVLKHIREKKWTDRGRQLVPGNHSYVGKGSGAPQATIDQIFI